MSSPDVAAAHFTEQASTWRGQPLPPVGSRIRAQYLSAIDGRIKTTTVSFTVRYEPTVNEGNLIIPAVPDKDGELSTVVLSSTCLADSWTLLSAAPAASLPEPSFEPIEQGEVSAIPAADPTDLPDMLKRWLYLKDRITEAEALVKTLKAEKSALNDQIVDECVEHEYTKPPGVGDFTFSFKPTYYTAYLEKEDGVKATSADVIAALRATGLDAGIVDEGYNGGTLKAMLRERKEANMPLPAELAAVVALVSKSELSATRSATRNRRGRPAAIDSE